MDAIRLLEQANVKVYRNVKETGRQLGVGSFGSVVELKIKGEGGKFAGKKIHEVLVVDGDATLLVRECKLMSELIHPNITRFCGVCKLPRYIIPALVMELMDHCLDEVIENVTAKFELTLMTTLSIFIDVANGLAYLHGRTPQVLHRDLTARNVLLDKHMHAKITDFGNSRIVDATRVSKTMTQAPGTQVYMPPEALDAHSKHTDRLDIFSFGHLALYALIQEFPKDLLPATHITSEGQLTARSEVERRGHYMEKLNTTLPVPDHHLYKLIKQCLHNDSTKRPSSTELLHLLQSIQGLEEGDYDDAYMEVESGAIAVSKSEKVATFLQQMEADSSKRTLVDSEYEGPKENKKTGLIEKWSGGIKKGWRAYLFTLDLKKKIFQYTRVGPFAKSPCIQLDDIIAVKPLKPQGVRFPFEVHFNGRNSPWVLNVYSEADRREWEVALSTSPEKMQSNISYGHFPSTDIKPKVDISEYEEIDAMRNYLPPIQEEDLYDDITVTNPREVSPVQRRGSLTPVNVHSNAAASPADNEDDVYDKLADVYDKLADAIKDTLTPSKVDILVQRLHGTATTRRSMAQQEQLTASAEYLQVPPQPPPPDHPPSPQKLPPLSQEGYYTLPPESSPQEEKPEDCVYEYPLMYVQETNPPPRPPKPPHLVTSGKAIYKNYEDEKLLVIDGANRVKDRPDWAVAPQGVPTSFEVLRNEALSISLSSLSCITKIGEGVFGEVYSAQMKGITVAVKVTKPYAAKQVIKDFLNEMNIMSQISHNNIVRLYGIINEGPLSPALVMEYLPHGNLQTFLTRAPQSNEFLLKCMNDVAEGMCYLCERGLIHRDLAARNVLVDKDTTCKVSDFGLLREVPRDNSIYISTTRGPSPLRWMAPESINDRVFSPASDVWSYGILQWEMFFPNKIPYPDMVDNAQMVVKVSSGYRMPIPRVCPSLAAKIMRACWQKNPRDRPSFRLISNLTSQ